MLVMVDVDNILWDFSTELHKKINFYYPNKNVPDRFSDWDEPFEYFTTQEFYSIVNEIHTNQPNYNPFENAKQFLLELKKRYCYIYIASNRKTEYYYNLQKWLWDYDLPYNSIFADKDKTTLLDNYEFDLVIDDNPYVQNKAKEKGIRTLSLRYPYNDGNCEMRDDLLELIPLI